MPLHLLILVARGLNPFWVLMLGVWMGASSLEASSSKIDILRERNLAKLKILQSILPEKMDQSDVLKDLELRLSGDRDYRGAIQARDERLALEAEISAIDKEIHLLQAAPSSVVHGVMNFEMADAQLIACHFEPVEASLGGLSEESVVLWPLPPHAKGGYEVLITFEGPPTVVKVEEEFYFLQSSTSKPAGSESSHALGILRLKGESQHLKMTFPLGVRAPAIQLVNVSLVPCAS